MDLSLCLQSLKETNKDIFKGKTVTIIGLGGVGSRVADLLVRHGINVRLIDKERVYDKELPRQTLFRNEDVSKFKAKQAKKHLENINKDSTIKTFHEELTEDNAFLLSGDMVVDTTNSHKITLISSKAAVSQGIPYISCNCAGMQATMLTYVPSKKGNDEFTVKEKHNSGTIKEKGMFSPISELMAGLVGSQILHYFANKEVNNSRIKVNLEPYSIEYSKIE